jgi:mRNA interferase RelE/StbE
MMAILGYEIELTEDAQRDFRSLDGHIRASLRQSLEIHLRHEPTKISKSRIKRLRELRQPQYRLRVDQCRVYYDVEDDVVTVLGIVMKAASYSWLEDNSIIEDD